MTYPCTLERIKAEDGVELCGLLSIAPADTTWGLIHVHGLSGNFYEQSFIDELLATGVSAGFRVLLFNNRGHDYFSDAIVWKNGVKSTLARGGAHERLDEGVTDIRAAVQFLRERGVTQVVITAHSTGAVKTILYLLRDRDPSVRSMVLLSPSDDIAIQKENAGDNFENLLNEAKALVMGGQPNKLMNESSFFYPIDAKAYLELFDPSGAGNVFDLTNAGGGLAPLRAVTIPMLVMFGSEDIAVVEPNKEIAAQQLVASLGSRELSRHAIINGAGHDYAGFEKALASEIAGWLKLVRSL
jgi:pimeloyl-ACP methyl ester carboxylesterase